MQTESNPGPMQLDEGVIVTFSVSVVTERGTVDTVAQGRRNPSPQIVADQIMTLLAQLHPGLVRSVSKELYKRFKEEYDGRDL